MRNTLLRIVFEAKEFVTGVRVHVRGELVLDSLPRGEVGGVLVAVFPDGAPRLQDGAWSGGADLRRRGQAVLEEAADHEGVGFRVEGVELGGDVGLRADDVELGLRCRVGLAVRVGVGFGRVGGGGRGRGGTEEDDFWEGKGRRVVVLGFGVNGRL